MDLRLRGDDVGGARGYPVRRGDDVGGGMADEKSPKDTTERSAGVRRKINKAFD